MCFRSSQRTLCSACPGHVDSVPALYLSHLPPSFDLVFPSCMFSFLTSTLSYVHAVRHVLCLCWRTGKRNQRTLYNTHRPWQTTQLTGQRTHRTLQKAQREGVTLRAVRCKVMDDDSDLALHMPSCHMSAALPAMHISLCEHDTSVLVALKTLFTSSYHFACH